MMVHAYTSEQEHLEDHLERLRVQALLYLRLHSDKLVGSDEVYTDRAVGRGELRRLLKLAPKTDGELWLDSVGVPPLEVAQAALDAAEELIADRLAVTVAEEREVVLPIEQLRAMFQLSSSELELLLAAAAPLLSEEHARLYAVAWADFGTRIPTASFLYEFVHSSASGAERPDVVRERFESFLGDASPLVRYRLVEVLEHPLWGAYTPRISAPVVVPRRILEVLQGIGLDAPGVSGCTLHWEQPEVDVELALDSSLVRKTVDALKQPRSRLLLCGMRGSGRRTLLCKLVLQGGGAVLEVDLGVLLESGPVGSTVWSEILREALLFNAIPLIRLDGVSWDDGVSRSLLALSVTLSHHNGPIVLTAERVEHELKRRIGLTSEVHFPVPTRAEQRSVWLSVLEGHIEAPESQAHILSSGYQLSPGSIHRIVAAARQHHANLSSGVLLQAIRDELGQQSESMAQAAPVELTLDDVVLTGEARQQLDDVLRYARNAEQVFQRWGFAQRSPGGNGLCILLSGPPGTGKTLVARVLAKTLGRLLFQIDLSRVVDKYIGETEKNLSRVFDEAGRAQAVLLFDEADSLFARRTDVKSSNDRYANLEVNFLLQKLEAYDGMSILTTNFAQGMDEAFLRRIRFRILFPIPEAEQRALLWRTLIPPRAPIAEDIDWGSLGEHFELSGGHIRNAILRAAMEASDINTSISMSQLWSAAVAECQETGTLVPARLLHPPSFPM